MVNGAHDIYSLKKKPHDTYIRNRWEIYRKQVNSYFKQLDWKIYLISEQDLVENDNLSVHNWISLNNVPTKFHNIYKFNKQYNIYRPPWIIFNSLILGILNDKLCMKNVVDDMMRRICCNKKNTKFSMACSK